MLEESYRSIHSNKRLFFLRPNKTMEDFIIANIYVAITFYKSLFTYIYCFKSLRKLSTVFYS